MKTLIIALLCSSSLFASFQSDRRTRTNNVGNSFSQALFYGDNNLDFDLRTNGLLLPMPIPLSLGVKVAYSRSAQKSTTDTKKTLQVSFDISQGNFVCFDCDENDENDENLERINGDDLMMSLLISQIWGFTPQSNYMSQEFGYRLGVSHTSLKYAEITKSFWFPSAYLMTRSIFIPKSNVSPYIVFDFGILKIYSLGLGVQWKL